MSTQPRADFAAVALCESVINRRDFAQRRSTVAQGFDVTLSTGLSPLPRIERFVCPLAEGDDHGRILCESDRFVDLRSHVLIDLTTFFEDRSLQRSKELVRLDGFEQWRVVSQLLQGLRSKTRRHYSNVLL